MKVLDLETTGLSFKKDRIIGVGMDSGFHQDLNVVKEELEQDPQLVGQNVKFDIKFLREKGVKCEAGFDTLIAASLLPDRPADLDLETLAKHYLGETESWKDMVDKKRMAEEDIARVAEYCLKDISVTKRLADKLLANLERHYMEPFYFGQLMPAYNMLIDMEQRGMRIDLNKLQLMKKSTEDSLVAVKAELSVHLPNINVASPKQLIPGLHKLGLFPEMYDRQEGRVKQSSAKLALEKLLPNPVIEKILEFRHLNKLMGFLKGWEEDNVNGYLYPSFNLAGTRTGRLSCSNPNLQQIPRDKAVRSLFIPSEGYIFVIADLAQIEPRIAAHYSMDPVLTETFIKGEDFYGTLARDILGADCSPNEVKSKYPQLRAVAKEVGLSILYGVGAKQLRERIAYGTGISYSIEECQVFIRNYFDKYAGLLSLKKYVEKHIKSSERKVVRNGKAEAGFIRNHFGRLNVIEYLNADQHGVNTLIQSTASDVMLFGASYLYNQLKTKGIDAHPVALVHDEIILECRPESVNIVKEMLNEALTQQGFTVPIKLDIGVGTSWADKG